MSTHYHLSQSIPGALKNWTLRDWKKATKWIAKDDGSRMTADELKCAFLDELAQGHTHLSFGGCDNFDPKKGCLGHPTP